MAPWYDNHKYGRRDTTLLYIAAADLVPEIKHEVNLRLAALHFISFLIGLGLLLGVRLVLGH